MSVQMGQSKYTKHTTYFAGNYSSASFDHMKNAVDVFLRLPGCILLVTSAGITRDSATTALGVIEHGHIKSPVRTNESFASFALSHIGIEMLEEPGNAILQDAEYQLVLVGIVSNPQTSPQIFLSTPWEAVFKRVNENPETLYEFSKNPRMFEEFIAESYRRAGFIVRLTPRSGDRGVDVIAELPGHGAIMIVEQTKAYSKGKVVTANDVRAMVGVLSTHPSASKAVITTTADFAPGVFGEFANLTPTRLELRDGIKLIQWLKTLERPNYFEH